MKASDLKVGDVIRWKNTGMGNGFMFAELLKYHEKPKGINKILARKGVRPGWECIPIVEPRYPSISSPSELAHWDRRITDEAMSWILSYGVLVSVIRDGVQIWPEVAK